MVSNKTTTTKKEEREVAVETTIRLSNSNSSNSREACPLNWEVKANPSDSKDSSNNSSKLEESSLHPRAVDGRTKVLAAVGAEVPLNPVAGKEIKIPLCTYEKDERGQQLSSTSKFTYTLVFKSFFKCMIYHAKVDVLY